MKKAILAAIFLASQTSLAADLDGIYSCNDGGTLELRRGGLTSYRASLTYGNSSSTLDVIEFHSADSMVGTMLPDEEGRLGRARKISGGLVLKFDNGETVTCLK